MFVIYTENRIKPQTLKTETQYIEFANSLRDTVYRLARSIITDDVEAEDIVQDVFERVWRARDAVLASQYPRAKQYKLIDEYVVNN